MLKRGISGESVPVSAAGVICVDFDGTIIDHEREPAFPGELGEKLRALRGDGVVWTISTGRALYHAVQGLTDHGVGVAPDFIIASERELYARTRLNRWVDVGKWNARCQKEHRKFFRANAKLFRRIRHFVESETSAQYVATEQEPAGIVATSETEMERICEFIDAETHRAPSLGYQRNSVYLRFGHAAYSKGSVLVELARHLGVSPESIFAAGDNYNDLSMLSGESARMVACPANAVEPVKKVVREAGGYVAHEAAGHGTLAAIRHYFG